MNQVASAQYHYKSIQAPNKGIKFYDDDYGTVGVGKGFTVVLSENSAEKGYKQPKELCELLIEDQVSQRLNGEGDLDNIGNGEGYYMTGLDKHDGMGLVYACYLSPDEKTLYTISVMHKDKSCAKAIKYLNQCWIDNE